jgi:hypothetical protein
MAGSYDKNVLSFIRSCQTLFSSGCTILHFFQQQMRVNSCGSTSLSAFAIVRVLNLGHLNRCSVVAVSCFNMQFPSDIQWVNILKHAYLPLMNFAWWGLFKILVNFNPSCLFPYCLCFVEALFCFVRQALTI